MCLFLIWTINSGSYYGLTLNVKNLGGNFYINLLINALMEIPAISLIIFAVAKFNIGRRKILIFSYLFCGILNLLVSLIQTNWIVDSSSSSSSIAQSKHRMCIYTFGQSLIYPSYHIYSIRTPQKQPKLKGSKFFQDFYE